MGLMLTMTAAFAVHMRQDTIQDDQVTTPLALKEAFGAGALTNVFAMPANNIHNARTYYTVAFTTATTASIKTVDMTFPTGFDVSSARLIQVQNLGAGSLTVAGQVVKYTVTTPVSVAAPKAIKIMIGDVTNPAFILNGPANQVSVVTRAISGPNQVIVDGPTNSATFPLIQVSGAMIGANAITGAKLATSAVDASKVQDGSLTRADMSAASLKKNVISDCANCVDGWNPGGNSKLFTNIIEPAVVRTSAVSVTIDASTPNTCSAYITAVGKFNVSCEVPVSDGAKLNYVVVN